MSNVSDVQAELPASPPEGPRVIVEHDGQRTDITDDLAVLYDAATSSMNWGSGFLDTDEVDSIRRIGRRMGYSDVPYQHDKCVHCGHDREKHHKEFKGFASALPRPAYCSGAVDGWRITNWMHTYGRPYHEHPDACRCADFLLREPEAYQKEDTPSAPAS